MAAILIAVASPACSSPESPSPDAEEAQGEPDGEHDGREGEHGEAGEADEGEEGGVYIARGDTWNATRRGARLILAFDDAAGAFRGRVENTTEATLCAVRVEVHLEGGVELGPTERADVAPGQSVEVTLNSGGHSFDTWTAHPGVSRCSTQ